MSDSVTPWIAARQAFLSITNSRSSLKLTSIESVMPSSHLILCRPLLLLPPVPPSIRVLHNKMLASLPLSYLLPSSSSIWINNGPRDGGKTNRHLTHAFALYEDIWCCISKIRFHQAASEYLQNVCRPSRQLTLSNFAFNFYAHSVQSPSVTIYLGGILNSFVLKGVCVC